MGTVSVSELLNLIGLSAGVVLYAMLLVMVVRPGHVTVTRPHRDPLLLVTSVLGLVWNLCALPAYELPKIGVEGPFPYLMAIGFGALGLLPAVVVHSVLRGDRDGSRGAWKRSLTAVAYAAAGLAIASPSPCGVDRWRRPEPAGHAASHLHLHRARPAAGGGDTTSARVTPRAVGGGARDVRGLGASSEPAAPRRCGVAGRAARPPRVAAAGVRHPLPGLSVRAGRSVPEARADAARDRRPRLRRRSRHSAVIRPPSLNSSSSTRGRSASWSRCGWHGARVSRSCAAPSSGSSTRSSCGGRTTRALRATIARTAQDARRCPDLLSESVPAARAGAERTIRDLARRRPRDADEPVGPSVVRGRRRPPWCSRTRHGEALPRLDGSVVTVPTSEPPDMSWSIAQLTGGRRFLSDDLAALEAIAVVVARRIDAIRLTTRTLRARDSRARDRQARDRGGAARAARADQPALPLQRADDDRLPDSDGAAERAARR